MLNELPALQGMSIVLLGDFNPKIFQPAWFASEQLIPATEAEKAEIKIINPEVVIFNLDWLEVQVTRNRCSFGTSQEPYYEVMRDLCMGTFKILRHTPIRMIGINKNVHYRMKSIEEWHALGHKLAPKDLWNIILEEPGMKSLTIEGKRKDGFKGYIRVKVEPSVKIHTAVFIGVNDHYEAEDPVVGSEKIINILEEYWGQSINKSETIINAIMEWK